MLEKEFEFYKQNQTDLVKKYGGKYIAIVGDKVVGDFDSELEAYTETKKNYAPGSFLIQHCRPGEDSTTETFHSRVAFY